MAGLRGDDRANAVLLLAGILLVLSFITVAEKLAETNEVERQAAGGSAFPIGGEWKNVVDHLSSSLQVATTVATANETFEVALERAVKGQAKVALLKGFQLHGTLGAERFGTPRTEWNLTVAGDPEGPGGGSPEVPTPGSSTYDNVTSDGAIDLAGVPYDGVNDGILWNPECARDATRGCIQAYYLHVVLGDGSSMVDAMILLPLNVEDPQWPAAILMPAPGVAS